MMMREVNTFLSPTKECFTMGIYYFETWKLIIEHNFRQAQPHDCKPSEQTYNGLSVGDHKGTPLLWR